MDDYLFLGLRGESIYDVLGIPYFIELTNFSISGINLAINFFAAFSFPSAALVFIFVQKLSPSEDKIS